MKQAVILAGGKGTRLKERLNGLPKPLIDVCGVPLLERQILLAKRYGFEQILILVDYRADAIIDFCASKKNWGLDIDCLSDGAPRGTAGAVLQVFDRLEDEFLLLYGDTMLDVDLDRFHTYHVGDGAAATLFLHPNDHPQDSDLVDVDEHGCITAFYPYPHAPDKFYPNLVSAALYWINKAALAPWKNGQDSVLDFGKQLFPIMLQAGLKLRGYNSPEYIKDCGTPTRIDKVCGDFLSGKIARSGLDHQQMAVFLDRDGTLNREVDHLKTPDELELFHGVPQAIRRLNQAEYRLCVATNQPVIARGECTPQTLHQIHNKMETLLGHEGAFIDRIFWCPHHPDKGFAGEVPELKIDCDCRKPKTGMIDKAVAELNIARRKSWMIGDATADMLAARRAGLKSILVETGHAGLDQKYWAPPNFTVPDFRAAVDFILDSYPVLYREVEPLLNDIRPGAVLFVGGQSRSGKSSMANIMACVLEDKRLRCHILSTDRWLLSETERGDGVLNRHDVQELHNVLSTLTKAEARPASLPLPGYRKLQREHVLHVETLALKPQDVIIIEGVVALHFAAALQAPHRFFITIDEALRKQRMLKEYQGRGYSPEAAETLYIERLQEEVPWVAATGKNALSISIASFLNSFSAGQPS